MIFWIKPYDEKGALALALNALAINSLDHLILHSD